MFPSNDPRGFSKIRRLSIKRVERGRRTGEQPMYKTRLVDTKNNIITTLSHGYP